MIVSIFQELLNCELESIVSLFSIHFKNFLNDTLYVYVAVCLHEITLLHFSVYCYTASTIFRIFINVLKSGTITFVHTAAYQMLRTE